MLRAIVFDFDGVIANSEPLHFTAFRDVLSEEMLEITEHEYYEAYLGFDDFQFFRTLGADRLAGWTEEDVKQLVARKAVQLEALERGTSILFPGAADAIRGAAASLPIAIASGARSEEIRRVLERENLASYFTAIVAAEDTPASKPAPDPYLRALTLLTPAAGGALDARDCVALEDSRWGLESARTAGMRTVGVAHTYSAGELRTADLVIASLADFDLQAVADLCR